MAFLSIKDYSFQYPNVEEYALNNISVDIKQGDFVVLCGESGSGKTTLLKMLKHDIAPNGYHTGDILYQNRSIDSLSFTERSQKIGYVFQKPKAQVVMGTVKDELVFGMENIGMPQQDMKKRMSEVVQFLGINHLLHREIHDLSGGQVQLVNLASVLMLYPDVLLLDEPTSQLDPVASQQFIKTLQRLNQEQAMTIIISEHNLDDLLSLADQMILLEEGSVKYDNHPQKVVEKMKDDGFTNDYLPLSTQLYLAKADKANESVPLNVKDTKVWLNKQRIIEETSQETVKKTSKNVLTLKNIDFQYSRKSPLIINRLSANFYYGHMHAILGGNGSGKTTLLKILANILKPQSGKVYMEGKIFKDIDMETIAYLPQDPGLFFVSDDVIGEYQQIANNYNLDDDRIDEVIDQFSLEKLINRHPYDLSGGQVQKAAIAGAILTQPDVLLLDEPTKGLDPTAKNELGQLLKSLTKAGKTIIFVTHDVEFAAKWADYCSLLFEGEFSSMETSQSFFANNYYYTTTMSRISRGIVDHPVVTLEEAVRGWQLI